METTVVKGLKVLEIISQNPEISSLTAIANECGISKSNVHRLLHTLEECGYVIRDPASRTYRPTLRQWEMGRRVFDRMDLRGTAVRYLAELAAKTEETVHLSVFDGDQVLYIDKVDGIHAVRTYVSPGERAPAYCTCSGKAMLAYMPADVIERVGMQIEHFTENTVRSPMLLRAQLEEVRQNGYARTSGEYREGVLSFARAIKTPSDRIIGGVGISGPKERMEQSDPERYITAIKQAVAAIEHDLGFSLNTETNKDMAKKTEPTIRRSKKKSETE